MEKLLFSTTIKADKKKVWNILWNDDTYRKWTSAFCEGSHAVTDNWQEGTKVLFLDPKKSGMLAEVVANKPEDFMSFRYLGEVKEGIEDTESESVKSWQGAHENYTLSAINDVITLNVEMDSIHAMKDYFEKTWPKAIDNIKELAEKS